MCDSVVLTETEVLDRKKRTISGSGKTSMGRNVGIEPTHVGTTIQCVNHFTNSAITILILSYFYKYCNYLFNFCNQNNLI